MNNEQKSSSKLTRRAAIAGGIGAAFAGLTLSEAEAAPKRERRPRPEREEPWKYVPMDPEKAAQYAYESYHPWGCMYGAFKGGMKAYAEANPEMEASVNAFPFLALRSGKTGCGAMELLCGTINGASLFMGMFVPDYADLCALIVKLSDFYKSTALPTFVPAEDKNPNFVKTISPSLMCADSKGTWLAVDESQEHKQLRQERCMRLTGSIMGKTIEILNEYFAENASSDEEET